MKDDPNKVAQLLSELKKKSSTEVSPGVVEVPSELIRKPSTVAEAEQTKAKLALDEAIESGDETKIAQAEVELQQVTKAKLALDEAIESGDETKIAQAEVELQQVLVEVGEVQCEASERSESDEGESTDGSDDDPCSGNLSISELKGR